MAVGEKIMKNEKAMMNNGQPGRRSQVSPSNKLDGSIMQNPLGLEFSGGVDFNRCPLVSH